MKNYHFYFRLNFQFADSTKNYQKNIAFCFLIAARICILSCRLHLLSSLSIVAAFLVCSCCCILNCRRHLHLLNMSELHRKRVSEIKCFHSDCFLQNVFKNNSKNSQLFRLIFKKWNLVFVFGAALFCCICRLQLAFAVAVGSCGLILLQDLLLRKFCGFKIRLNRPKSVHRIHIRRSLCRIRARQNADGN